MPDDPNSVGDLSINITGDWSDLESALSDAQNAAAAGGDAISEALDVQVGTDLTDSITATSDALTQAGTDAGTAGTEISDAMAQVDSAAGDTGAAVSTAADQIQEFSGAATGAEPPLHDLGEAAHDAGESAHESGEEWKEFAEILAAVTGVELTIEGLKELGQEALEAFSSVQKAEIALTAMTGSAEQTEETLAKLKSLAVDDALSLPQLVQGAQRMTAFGFAAEKIPEALEAAANAAAATGNDLDRVTNAIDRMAASGTAGSRQLVTLGLSLDSLGAALGVASEDATEAFKDLPDSTARLNVLTTALQRFSGIAQLEAQTVAGEWQRLKAQWDLAFESLGADTASGVLLLEQFAQNAAVMARAAFDAAGSVETLVGSMARLASSQLPAWMQPSSTNNFKFLGDTFLALSIAIQTVANAWSNSGPQIDQMARLIQTSITNMVHAGTTGSKDFQFAWTTAVDQASHSATVLGQGSLDVLDKIKNLNEEVTRSKAVFDNLNSAFQAGTVLANGQTVSISAVNQAWNDYQSALKNANVQMKTAKDAQDTLVASFAKSQTAFVAAVTEFEQLSAGFAKGTVSVALFEEAYTKASSSAKAAGQDFISLTAEAVKLAQGVKDTGTEIQQVNTDMQVLGQYLLQGSITTAEFNAAISQLVSQRTALQQLLHPDPTNAFASEINAATAALQNLADNVVRDFQLAQLPLGNMDNALKQVQEVFVSVGQAAQAAGVTTREQLAQQINQTLDLIQAVEGLKDASDDWSSDQQADLDALIVKLGKLEDEYDKVGVEIDKTSAKGDAFTKALDSGLKQVSDQIGSAIIEGQSFGQTMTTIMDDIAKKIISTVVDAAFGSLLSAIGQANSQMLTLGKLFNGLFGGGASAAGSAASSGASAAGSAAGSVGSAGSAVSSSVSSVVGIVGAIGSVVGAIAGIIGDVQGAHDMETFGQIETNTRETATQVIDMQGTLNSILGAELEREAWEPTVTQLLVGMSSDLDGIAANMTSLLALERQVVSGTAAGSTPHLTSATINFTIKDSNNPTQMMRTIAQTLRGRGITFDPSKVS